jgi:transposase InsO family protein
MHSVLFIDDYSRHGIVYFLRNKNQCIDAFKELLAWAETQTSDKMLILHSDRGGEYMSDALGALLAEKGIEHKLQQNGLVERWNRTILDKARVCYTARLSIISLLL